MFRKDVRLSSLLYSRWACVCTRAREREREREVARLGRDIKKKQQVFTWQRVGPSLVFKLTSVYIATNLKCPGSRVYDPLG